LTDSIVHLLSDGNVIDISYGGPVIGKCVVKLFERTFVSLAIAITIFVPDSVLCANQSSVVALTNQAASLFKEGKLQDAVDIESRAIKENPKDWLSHAAMSFFYWQQGNAPDAIIEGQKAVRLAPQSEIALTNLAHMHQALESYQDAIPLYQEARKISPNNWVPAVSLVRCYVKSNQTEEALKILGGMAAENGNTFYWYYQVGTTYLTLDKPGLAVAALTKALDLSASPEQKSASENQLFLALLRDHQIDQARLKMDTIFKTYRPKNAEIYVRTASSLLPVLDPSAGKTLFKSAVDNLDETIDSDAFFRLGKIFEDKSNRDSGKVSSAAGWMNNAVDAYNQAIELNPGVAAYHLALAGVLERQGKVGEASAALAQARSYDKYDPLAPYLVSAIDKRNGNLLTAVNFKINGLTCGCQVSKLEAALRNTKGVVFVKVSALKPYGGTILVDKSLTPIPEVFSKCPGIAFDTAALKEPITFDITSEQAVASIERAVSIAQTTRFGDILQFPRQFELIPPVIPITLAVRS
jgi:pentatricopeptide repeat protein